MQEIALRIDGESMLSRIENEKDRILIKEAILAYHGRALRAAYVMTWIACAESIKRRISESASWDKEAESIQTRIRGLEHNQKAIDGKILELASSIGMIDEIEAEQLANVYKNRNIYGHPYERTPSEAEVISAIELVCDAVLSKPLRYKHRFIKGLQDDLFARKSFLDDTYGAVDEYVNNFVLKRVDPCVYKILIERCWKGLDKIVGDKSNNLFVRRVARFCQTLIINSDVFDEWSSDDWHQAICHYSGALHIICFREEILKRLDDRAITSWFAFALEQAEIHPEEYGGLFMFEKLGILTPRQIEQLHVGISGCKGNGLLQTNIGLEELFPIIKSKLTVYDFAKLGDVFNFLFYSKREDVSKLQCEDQEYIGTCLVDGVRRGAYALDWILNSICNGHLEVPLAVLKGIVLRTFLEADGCLYIKDAIWLKVMTRISSQDPQNVAPLIADVAKAILAATSQNTPIEQMQAVASKLAICANCEPIAKALSMLAIGKGRSF